MVGRLSGRHGVRSQWHGGGRMTSPAATERGGGWGRGADLEQDRRAWDGRTKNVLLVLLLYQSFTVM
jgi:hypothetical protein